MFGDCGADPIDKQHPVLVNGVVGIISDRDSADEHVASRKAAADAGRNRYPVLRAGCNCRVRDCRDRGDHPTSRDRVDGSWLEAAREWLCKKYRTWRGRDAVWRDAIRKRIRC